jgi:S1-C subfamily serine protease
MEKVNEVMKEAVRKGSKKDGWIGISVVDLENGSYGRGVRVLDVVPGGPTDIAEICGGDTIIQFEGKSIRDARELAKWVRTTPPDNYITFTLIKAAQKVNRQVLVERMPSMKEQR